MDSLFTAPENDSHDVQWIGCSICVHTCLRVTFSCICTAADGILNRNIRLCDFYSQIYITFQT